MPVEELEVLQKEVERDRKRRYPTIDIVNNREEIRIISENTLTYAGTIYDDLKDLPEDIWHIVPTAVCEFMKGCYSFLNAHKKKDMTEARIEIGDFIKFAIEYGTTENADTDATFNPLIELGAELQYYNDDPSKNTVPTTAPDIPEDQNVEFVCKVAQNVLKDKYAITIEDWRSILHLFVAFIRQAREFLILHKDSDDENADDCGCEINLCEVVDLGIEKYDTDKGVEYCIQFAPGQQLKLASKDNEKTESTEQTTEETAE